MHITHNAYALKKQYEEVLLNEVDKIKKDNIVSNESKWASLKKLDEDTNWKERTEVITKNDHKDYMSYATEMLYDIVEKAATVAEEANDSFHTPMKSPATSFKVSSLHADVITGSPSSMIKKSAKTKNIVDQYISNPPNLFSEFKSDADSMIVKTGISETLNNENNHPCITQKNNTNTSIDFSLSTNSPGKIKDPFTSTKCLENTPDKVKDPFTSNKCLENTQDKVKDPFTLTKCLENSPVKVENPFTSTKCLENTPVSMESTLVKTESTVESQSNNDSKYNVGKAKHNKKLSNTAQEFTYNGDIESKCNESNKFKTPEKTKKSKAFDFCVNSSNFNVLSGSPSSLIKKSERTKNIIQNNVTNPLDFEEFRNGAELLNEGFEFDLDFLANKGETGMSRDLRKESLYVKFDPFVSDSPRRRTNIGRPSDIIDFSDNRKSMIKQRVISLNNDLSAETKPEIQTESRCLLDMNSYEDVDVTVVDGNDTVIGRQPENSSAFKDGDQLIEISTFSQTQLTQAVEKAREPLLEKIKQLEEMNENLKTEHGFEMQKVKDEHKNVSTKDKNKFLAIEKKLQQVENNLKKDIQISNEHIKMKSSYETKFKKYQEQNEHLKSALAKSEDNHFSLYQRSKSMQDQLNKYKKNESLYKDSFKKCSEKNANLVVQFNEMKNSLESQLPQNSEQSKKRTKAYESQNNAYKIKIRSLESKAKSAETALEQKTKECQELNQLCEEMFAQQNS